MSPRARTGPGAGRAGVLAVSLYCFVLLVGGFFHHDLACHLKSPTHCTTCTFSLSSAGVQPGGGVPPVVLPQAGRSGRDLRLPCLATVVVHITGRSPPA